MYPSRYYPTRFYPGRYWPRAGVGVIAIPDLRVALVALLKADATLNALVAGRVYPSKRPQGKALPAITYQVVSGRDSHHLAGPDGTAAARVQFDCWGRGLDDCIAIKARLRELLHGRPGDRRPIVWSWNVGEIDMHEFAQKSADIDVFRVVVDYMIRHAPGTS